MVPIVVIAYLWYRKTSVEYKRVKASKENHDIEGLVKGLTYSKSIVRNEAVKALGELKDPAAIDALVRALNDRDSDVRNNAAYSLQEYGVENLGALITGIAKYPNYSFGVKPAATRPIDINVSAQPDPVHVQSRYVTCDLGLETISILIPAMGSNDPLLRENAIAILRLFGSFAIDPLIKALGDSDNNLKVKIVIVLGDIGDVRALESVKSLLTDNDPAVRDVAAIVQKRLDTTDPVDDIPVSGVNISDIVAGMWATGVSQDPDDAVTTDKPYLKDLEKLGELRSKGILSDEEFQREKKQILFNANKVEKIKCQYCGSFIEAYNEKCPTCGAPINKTDTSPETSEN